jgi:hypothetical protein
MKGETSNDAIPRFGEERVVSPTDAYRHTGNEKAANVPTQGSGVSRTVYAREGHQSSIRFTVNVPDLEQRKQNKALNKR